MTMERSSRLKGNNPLKIPIHGVSILYTYKCNAYCDHCVYDCSKLKTEKMSLEFAKKCVLEAYMAGTPWVNIAGGEPFLYFKEIAELVKFAASLKLNVTVVTNAYWAKSLKYANMLLAKLKLNGLTKIGISVDDFHSKYVEWGRIENAIKAAKANGMEVRIMAVVNERNKLSKAVEAHIFRLKVNKKTSSLQPFGRGKALLPKLKSNMWRGCCRFQTILTISPIGDVLSCCGCSFELNENNPLSLGNIRTQSLKEMLKKRDRTNSLLFISRYGPKGLYTHLTKKYHIQLKPLAYYKNTCQLCVDMLDTPDIHKLKIPACSIK